jgi:uncharacterized protein YecA (UPF0149 family)
MRREVQVIETFRKLFGSGARRPEESLSRNDPCWCGSGEKYKRCHMEKDLKDDRRKASSCKGYS